MLPVRSRPGAVRSPTLKYVTRGPGRVAPPGPRRNLNHADAQSETHLAAGEVCGALPVQQVGGDVQPPVQTRVSPFQATLLRGDAEREG
jgi:hypothetical protein